MGKSDQGQSPKQSEQAAEGKEEPKAPAPKSTGKTFSQRGVEVQK